MRRGPGVLMAPVALLLAGALAGCGGGDTPPSAASPAPATTTATAAAPADPAAAASTAAAEAFLAALVDEDYEVAYDLFSDQVRSALTLEQFTAARQAKTASARSLGRRYALTAAAGDDERRTVTGEAFLADGTIVDISLPMTQTPKGWRLDAQPTNY